MLFFLARICFDKLTHPVIIDVFVSLYQVNTLKTKSDQIQGIDVNLFYPDMSIDYSDEGQEASQRSGE